MFWWINKILYTILSWWVCLFASENILPFNYEDYLITPSSLHRKFSCIAECYVMVLDSNTQLQFQHPRSNTGTDSGHRECGFSPVFLYLRIKCPDTYPNLWTYGYNYSQIGTRIIIRSGASRLITIYRINSTFVKLCIEAALSRGANKILYTVGIICFKHAEMDTKST